VRRRDVAAPHESYEPSTAVLALFEGDEVELLALSRPPAPHDEVDLASQMATLAAASTLPGAVIAVPVQLRDLVEDEVIDRPVLVTRLERLPDGGVDLMAYAFHEDAPPATPLDRTGTVAIDPAISPMSALLYDAVVRVDDAPPLAQVAAVLGGWGHELLPREPLPEVDHARLGRDRHRVRRLARELAHRNRPARRSDAAGRPGVPANLPAGFVPACPL
jgi:hypothetical protein